MTSIKKRLSRRLWAFWLGFRDGWGQPIELSTSANVDFLVLDEDHHVQVWHALEGGLCWGQLLRKGTASQVWREGLYPTRHVQHHILGREWVR